MCKNRARIRNVELPPFVSEATELKELAKGLGAAKYQMALPDERPVRIIRQGLVSSSKYTKEYTFVLFPLENMPGMFEYGSPVGGD